MATPANRRPPSKRATARCSRGRRARNSRASAPKSKRRAGRSPKPRNPPSTKSVWMASTWWTTSHSNAPSPSSAAMNPAGVAAGKSTRSAIWIPTKAVKTKYEDRVAMTYRSVRLYLHLLLIYLTALAADQLQVVAGPQTKAAPLTGVAAVRNDAEQHNFERMQHPGILELWNGNFDFGLALARGNARSDTLNTAFTAIRSTRTDKIAVYFNQIYSTARANNVNSTTASAVRGG